MRRARRVRAALTATLLTALVATSAGCGVLGGGDDGEEPAEPTSAATPEGIDSQFTRDGTFQSHIEAQGISDVDFVFTIYPTKSTPRTNEWYPKGKKYFSFTFQAYDLARKLRDPFATKRLVYLDRIEVTSRTVTSDGGKTQRPYRLDASARTITFDPEPVTTPQGMLITSPKGAFELRNQAIAPTSTDTVGVELTFRATVNVETAPGADQFEQRTVEQVVPIAIFPSDERTKAAKIPVNAN